MGGDWTGERDRGADGRSHRAMGGASGTASTTVAALYPQCGVSASARARCVAGVSEDITLASRKPRIGRSMERPWPRHGRPRRVDFNLTYTDVATGCPLELDYTIDLLTADIPTLPGAFATCAGAGVSLLLEAGAGADVIWSPAGELDDATAEQPLATPLVTTIFDATSPIYARPQPR